MKFTGSNNLHRIVVLNPKGGSGKTTLAFNVAGYIASTGRKVALIDMDPLCSSSFWLQNRPARLPSIFGVRVPTVEGLPKSNHAIELPSDIDYAVIDAPAGLPAKALAEHTVGTHAILIPVMPSDIDIHAASRLVKDLLLVARVSRVNGRLGVVANRVRDRTLAYRRLMRFLHQLSIAVVGVIRDSQNYVTAAHRGMCIHELPRSKVKADLEQWESVTEWLEARLATPLNERDFRAPATEPSAEVMPAKRRILALSAAAGVAAVVCVSAVLWLSGRAPDGEEAESPPLAGAIAGAPPVTAAAIDGQGFEADELVAVVSPIVSSEDAAAGLEHAMLAEAESGGGQPAVEEATPLPLTADMMREKWLLSGVAQSAGSNVVLLTDLSDLTTHRVMTKGRIDGWLVAEAGRDYALLRQDEMEVRLELSKTSMASQQVH